MSETQETTEATDAAGAVSNALRHAYSLGQTYWQQADSESYSQNKKADETERRFATLVKETRAMVLAEELVRDPLTEVLGQMLSALEIAQKFCGSLSADDFPDTVAIPITNAVNEGRKALTKPDGAASLLSDVLELLPCPFCGGEARPTAHLTYSWFAPVCKSCGVSGPSVRIASGADRQKLRELMNKADALWNTRAPNAGYATHPLEGLEKYHVEIPVAGEERQTANVVRMETPEVVGEVGCGAANGTRNDGRVWFNGGAGTHCDGCAETVGWGVKWVFTPSDA